MAEEVHLGRGIAILRGLDPSKYTLEDNILIYAGVASYVGETRGTQDNDGNILGLFDSCLGETAQRLTKGLLKSAYPERGRTCCAS